MSKAPKNDEFWVVEDTDRGVRFVAQCFYYRPDGDPYWLRAGSDQPDPADWYAPVRKVVLGRAARAKKVGADLGASAQNGR